MTETVKNVDKSFEIEPFSSWKLELESTLDAAQIELVEAVAERDAVQLANRNAVAAKSFVARAVSVIPPQRIWRDRLPVSGTVGIQHRSGASKF